jgi:hypothetical protein
VDAYNVAENLEIGQHLSSINLANIEISRRSSLYLCADETVLHCYT